MDFEAQHEHELIRESVRDFFDRELPEAKIREYDRARRIPRSIWKQFAQQGWMGISVPEEYGGAGSDIMAGAIFCEELARRFPSLATDWLLTSMTARLFLEVASEDHKREYLPKLVQGEFLMGFGMSEPGGGTDVLSLKTRAQIDADGWTVRGQKLYTSLADDADAILVHHGLFWRGQDGRVTGWMRERLRLLLGSGVHLLAYHLPLDAHPELGNNAQLGRLMGAQAQARFGEQDLGFIGTFGEASAEALATRLSALLGRTLTWVPGDGRPIRRLAWCTGGAQGYFEAAIAAGADAFVTGEISEPQAHLARETGVAFLACGHHATERYGVQAVGEYLAQEFGIRHEFIDIDNPV